MIQGASRPKLAKKARLRYDEKTSGWLLVYPERGLALSSTASEILKLCDGIASVDDISARLCASFTGGDPEQIGKDVRSFLASLDERGLLEIEP